jgi:hypothetical protein
VAVGHHGPYHAAVVLEAWLADLQVEEAAAARARAAWLRRQAEEEASFVGLLADLAERERTVVVDTTLGRRHGGWLRVVGRDFCCVRTGRAIDVLIHYDAVTVVRPAPRQEGTVGDRTVTPVATLAGAMAALVGARVSVGSLGGAVLHGELRSVGRDVAALRLDDRGACYVRLASLAELSVVESG